MKRCLMAVRATPGGWLVLADGLAPLMFRSGAHAERAAYKLAKSQVQAGCEVELSIFDRQDELAAQITLHGDGSRTPARPAARVDGGRPHWERSAAVVTGAGRLTHVAAAAFSARFARREDAQPDRSQTGQGEARGTWSFAEAI